MSSEDFDQICFVIMPFGTKKVGDKTVDFNMIYDQIFEPAIKLAKTPEGSQLVPRRTDKDAFSGSIIQDMYELLIYSRMAIADISGLNPNAFYELGARHAMQEAGTTILRQTGHDIPFDISTIKVFEYEAKNDKARKASQRTIGQVLTDTLERNKLDSPIRQALGYAAYRDGRRSVDTVAAEQDADTSETDTDDHNAAAEEVSEQTIAAIVAPVLNLEALMCDAEDAMMHKDWSVARGILRAVLHLDPSHQRARFKLGEALNEEGKILEAAQEFAMLTRLHPEFGPGWREKGIAESKLIRCFEKEKDRLAAAPGAEHSFRRAIALQPEDFDAMSSYGGLLRRIGQEQRALEMYESATEVSDGNPYPLLNAVKLQARQNKSGKVKMDPKLMMKARDFRTRQAESKPPAAAPWCHFDLAVMDLFEGDVDGAKKKLKQGFTHADSKNDWMLGTLHNDIDQTLVKGEVKMDGLDTFMETIEAEMKKRDANQKKSG